MNRRNFLQLSCATFSLPFASQKLWALSPVTLEGAFLAPHYSATKQKVANRGVPPDDFLDQLIAWGRTAPDELFAAGTNNDVYASVIQVLGPWKDNLQRKAAMLEIMRVLAGFESSWKWNAGRDTTNPSSVTPDTIEAGAWQVSANSIHFGPDLRALVLKKAGTLDELPSSK